ncbi:MAG: hypothetical protein WCY48_08575 [Candidatus Caldatribacteriota bacterium]
MSYFKGQDAERMGLRPSEKKCHFDTLKKIWGFCDTTSHFLAPEADEKNNSRYLDNLVQIGVG